MPAVAARTPAHGPAAFTTRRRRSRPRVGVHAPHPAASRPDALDPDAELDLGARTPREGRVPVGEARGVRDPVLRAVRRADQTIDRDPRRELDRLLGRQDLGLDAQRRVQPVGGQEVAPQLLAADQEQVAVLHDVERQPVLPREPRDHRHARLGQANVDRARELEAEPPGARPGRPRGEVIGSLEHQDPSGARGGQVVRGARADDASPHHDDVGGPVHGEPPSGARTRSRPRGAITQSSPRYASRMSGLSSRFFAVSASTTWPVWIT